MICKLEMKNFRKHTDRVIDFKSGLNVLRGANENGKTTILEAILYAFFGVGALREPLVDVVTYDQPETSLKVRLEFQFMGVDYVIVRGKSGAELAYGDQSVTGQTAVKQFMEKLFGCSMDTACNLMFATQNSVQGILEEGGTAANNLVEGLSELKVIEDLIDKIQAQLPTGNTGEIDRQVVAAQARVVEPPEKPSEEALDTARMELADFSEKIDLLKRAVAPDQDVVNAKGAVDRFNAATARISKIRSILEVPVTAPGYTDDDLTVLKLDQAGAPERARRRAAFTTVFPKPSMVWEGDTASYAEAVAASHADVDKYTEEVTRLTVAINTALMMKINEKSCSFCKKDLSEVPEVAEINLRADQQIETLAKELDSAKSLLDKAKSDRSSYALLDVACAKIRELAGDYWSLSDTIPPVPTWKGEEPVPESPKVDIPILEQKLRAYQSELAKREVLEAELLELDQATFYDVTEQREFLDEQERLEKELEAETLNRSKVERFIREEQIRLDAAMKAYRLALSQIEASKKLVDDLTVTRNSMVENNELIKKLRAIRPQVASQLWGTVLGAVSHYFSQIRGFPCKVERDVDGFKVNGRSIKGLSGSTLDALGLSIRVSLSTLFLPNVPFLLLDESFSGADDNRELSGIATLSSLGTEQVIIVTHSPLPESFANNLIVLE